MKPKHFDIKIPDDGTDPFGNCMLERKQYAIILTDIINSFDDSFVLALNNEWGTGKTTFVKMWEQQLKNDKYQTLYFNAWENDFQQEVIIAILAELHVLRDKADDQYSTVLEKSKKFLKKVAPTVVKGVISKAIGSDAIAEIAEAVTEFTTEEIELKIDSFNEKKDGINEFRTSLEKFVKKVDDKKPIIFIIDELDRCRPNYAVKVLEQIKHLFSVPGIVFVLSIDKIQLGHAVRGVYGSESIDSTEYLRRFIDLEFSLPDPNISAYCDYLFEYYDFDEFFGNQERKKHSKLKHDDQYFKRISTILFTIQKSTLRQIEKTYTHSRIGLSTFDTRHYVFPYVYFSLVFIKQFNPNFFNQIKFKKLTPQSFIDQFESLFSSHQYKLNDRNILIHIEVMILNFYLNYLNDEIYKPADKHELIDKEDKLLIKSKIDNSIGNEDIKKVVKNFSSSHYDYYERKIDFLLKKVELLDSINK